MAERIDGPAGIRSMAIKPSPEPSADKSTKADPASTSKTPNTADTVALTDAAQKLNRMENDMPTDGQYFDKERVEAIKKSIADGTYVVDSDRVADKFLETERQLGDL